MSSAHLGLDSFADPIWLVTANLFGYSLAILDGDHYFNIFVDNLASRIRNFAALRIDNLLLPDLLHRLAFRCGHVIAVFHWHHLRFL